jgi:hypothetical protein
VVYQKEKLLLFLNKEFPDKFSKRNVAIICGTATDLGKEDGGH